MAELSAPFPPGEYPVVVVGSGPGALQLVGSLRALGVDHAVLSADPSPGGMFRRWPFFQRLLSWTKPHAPAKRGTPRLRALRLEQPARVPTRTAGASSRADGRDLVLPVAAGDGGEPRDFRRAGRGDRPLRLPLDRDPTDRGRRRRSFRAGDQRRGLSLPDAGPGGRGRRAIHAARGRDGAHPPLRRCPSGRELRRHRRVCSSASRTPGSSWQRASCRGPRQLVLASPSKTRLSVDTRTLVGVRARYVQPYEDFVLGGGVSVLDAAIDRIEGAAEGRRPSTCAGPTAGPTSRSRWTTSISATGFVCPLVDLPDLGVGVLRAEPSAGPDPVVGEREPCRASSSRGRSGRARRDSRSTACRRTPGPSMVRATTPGSSPARIASERFGIEPDRPHLAPDAIAGFVATELAESARALPPARLSGPRPPRTRPGDARRGHRAADPRPRRRRHRTRSRRPSRPTDRVPSTRSSTRGSGARSSNRSSSRTR